jgi:hypothetical protein
VSKLTISTATSAGGATAGAVVAAAATPTAAASAAAPAALLSPSSIARAASPMPLSPSTAMTPHAVSDARKDSSAASPGWPAFVQVLLANNNPDTCCVALWYIHPPAAAGHRAQPPVTLLAEHAHSANAQEIEAMRDIPIKQDAYLTAKQKGQRKLHTSMKRSIWGW